ncbi:MAG: hypothetical protein LH473_08490, partial [Chitinophagales bacterium]|nr:hypothetical protein [Chitinophagales bacterium]
MKNKLIIITAVSLILSARFLSAQTTETQPRDLPSDHSTIVDNEAIPYDYVSESDVLWHKRVWRVIDVNEKMNLPFRYEGLDWSVLKPLVATLRDGAISGELQVYDDDQFLSTLTPVQVRQKGGGFDTLPTYNLDGEVIGDTVVERNFNPLK